METVLEQGQNKGQVEAGVIDTRRSPFAAQWPAPVGAVQIDGGFWKQFVDLNCRVVIPIVLERLEAHGRLDRYLIASGMKQGQLQGRDASDSDIGKWLEAASYALQGEADVEIRAEVDRVVEVVASAQEPEGYLGTAFMGDRKSLRFTDLRHGHEMYVAGHLIMGAVAHHRATGSSRLLDVATRLADHLCATFGPVETQGTCGHPGIEMALVELYRETRSHRYLDLAQFLIDSRGSAFRDVDVRQRLALLDQKHFRELKEFTGAHAVRALYLACGATDVYLETGDRSLLDALNNLWEDTTASKTYVTGGVGARHQHEAFGEAYELPNLRAYSETCGAIASVLWSQRMLAVEPRAAYGDVLETALYNGVLSGVSLDGRLFFYTNPLEARADSADAPLPTRNGFVREPWFDTTCCPTNIARLLASLPGYFYGCSKEGLYVHLYGSSTLRWRLADGTPLRISQTTDYPWDGHVELAVNPVRPVHFALFLRIPSWCQQVTLNVNGQRVQDPKVGSHARISREWRAGDRVCLEMDISPRFTECHPRVRENAGCYALGRGPVVYCLEGIDNPDLSMLDVEWLVQGEQLGALVRIEEGEGMLAGAKVLRAKGLSLARVTQEPLYRTATRQGAEVLAEVELTAIPYYARANRGRTWMKVWVPYRTQRP